MNGDTECPHCDGNGIARRVISGAKHEWPCPKCAGSGRAQPSNEGGKINMGAPNPFREVATDSRGNTLFCEETEQGRAYWSDEIGGGVLVWHTALVSPEMMALAMKAEYEAHLLEIGGAA